jgi:hypothetical protein
MSEPTRGYFEEYRCGCVYRWGKFDRPSVATLVAALDAERNNRFAADEAMVTLHEALQKAETELDAERRRAEAAEARCAAAEVDRVDHALAAQQRMLDALKAENAALRVELTAHRDRTRGDYWAWQGDGGDYLESLVCPVLIPAASLRGIIAEHDALRQEVAGLRAGLGRMTPLAERAALVIAHHALNSRECSLVCRRCEAEKVLAQARQLLDRPT